MAKAFCHLPLHHYRPSNLPNPVSLFAVTSPASPSPTEPPPPPQFGGHFIIPTVAVAASAWFFFRLRQYPPIITAPFDSHLLELEQLKELPLLHKPGALHIYKVKPGTVSKLIDVYPSHDYHSLKARIRLSADWLEAARQELHHVVDRDPARVMEYSQVLDDLMDILNDMDLYIDQCQRDNVKGYLRSCNRLLARVRRMEAHILNLIQQFHQGPDSFQ